MKLFIFFILVLILCSTSYSIEQQTKTLVETVTIPIKIDSLYEGLDFSNIKIYSPENVKLTIPFNLHKIDNANYILAFYLYSNFSTGNYSIVVQNAKILNNNILKEKNYSYSFWADKKTSSLKIDPMVIFLDQDNTPVDIFVSSYSENNMSVDVDLIIQPNTEVLGDNVILASIDSKKLVPYTVHNIEVLVKNVKSKYIGKLILNTTERKYEIFVYSKSYFNLENINILANKSLIFLNDKDYINLSLEYGQSVDGGGGQIIIKNNGEFTINRINLALSGDLNDVIRLGNISITGLDKGNETSFFLYVNENLSAKEGFYQGNITAAYDSGEINLPVYIGILPKSFEHLDNKTTDIDNATYNATNINSKKEGKESNYPLLLLILIVVILLVLVFFYIRNSKKKNTPDQKDKFEEIISKYEDK